MKTKEQQAEEYAKEQRNIRLFGQRVCRNISIEERQEDAFIAGYEAAQRWISVEEELPPLNKLIACVDINYMASFQTFKTEVRRDGAIRYRGFTHWLPIPKLPTE